VAEYTSDDLAEMTDQLYGAVYDDGQWGDVLAAFRRKLNGGKGAIGYFDKATLERVPLAADCAPGYDESFLDPALENPAIDRFLGGRSGHMFADHTVISRTELERGKFYNEWLRPQGQRSFFSLITLRHGSVTGHMSILRDASQPAFDDHDLAFMERLSPVLQNVARLRRRVGALRLAGESDAFERLHIGFLVVDGHGRLLSANATGEGFLSAPCSGLDTQRSYVTTQSLAERTLLRRAIASACTDVDGCMALGGDLAITNPETGLPSVALSIMPIRDASILGLPVGRAAAIVVQDLAARLSPHFEEQIRAVFGLTAKEAALAAALTSGLTLKQAAAERMVSMATARTQLAQLFRKTRTNQQSQLVSLLRSIRPIGRNN